MGFLDPNIFDYNPQEHIDSILIKGRLSAMSIEQIINQEVSEWKSSQKRKWMLTGERYYRNKTDILERQRMAVGESGALEPVANLANNKLANAFVRKLVDQKVGYLLGKPLSVQTDKDEYAKLLNGFFDKAMMRRLQSTGKEAVNKGIGWMHVYYDENGNLSFKKMCSEEIIPLWRDEAHTVLDAIIRVYDVVVFEGTQRKTVTKAEWWDTNGVKRYVYDGIGIQPDIEAGEAGSHLFMDVEGQEEPAALNWQRIPFIPFKYNEEEQPLVELIKSLVDDYDRNKSDNSNNLEDLPNSLFVVKNYNGTDAGEFRKNISVYRTVFTEGDGGLDSVSIDIDTEAYKTHMEIARKDIYEFGRGVDTTSENFGGDKSGVALKFLYADLDMDANMMETEFQASLEQLLWFINMHLYNTTKVDYSAEQVDFIFNRDIMINETQVIEDIKNSVGLLSDETLLANHPYVTDVNAEKKRKEEEKERSMQELDTYAGLPGDNLDGSTEGEGEE
ncbi:phage portal protein [Brevibacillus sp. M2.1A]|uniref:phage portal protein n=1 Tax=Brevibacillus sp. M2.1A TaxID=2738980 RepID=UPI00156AC7B2|nr:phage portal protein [Brevibacillus sp. M2.1A]MCC8435467.1 phage portal protein [Brevibacillus sp. M2.1A]